MARHDVFHSAHHLPRSTAVVASNWMTKARCTDNRIGWSLEAGIRPSWHRRLALLATDNKRSVDHPRNLANGLKDYEILLPVNFSVTGLDKA